MFATFVNVPVHVILGLDPVLDTLQEGDTASSDPRAAEVSEAQRRTVSDEDIRVLGDQIPFPQTLLPSLEVKCPASELRLPRRALKENWFSYIIIREFEKCAAHYRDKYYPSPKYF